MTISIWRYSHLLLAVFSFLFLTIAASTGIILSFEPIAQKVQQPQANSFSKLNLAQTLPALRNKYPDIATIEVLPNGTVLAKGSDENGDKLEAFVDPTTGRVLGHPQRQSDFFKWATSLHRSLFLHETGRALVGITAFLLLLITISGIMLVVKRQQGLRRFFGKVARDGFAQYYHVLLSRFALFPILIIAFTGAYLSVLRFELIKKPKQQELKVDFDSIKDAPKLNADDFDSFKALQLSEIKSIEFPFSTDVEDYYIIHGVNGDQAINQVTGEVLARTVVDNATWWEDLSLTLHTGRGSTIWALVLALASANILFFIYSGFVITFKRLSGKTRNQFKAQEAELIILVGSENGSTFKFAGALHKQLIKQGIKSYLTGMNAYQNYPNAKQMVVFTATYGLGDAPTNAQKFLKLLEKQPQLQTIETAVLGFGSRAYPDFCRYAIAVDAQLAKQSWAKPMLSLHTVADRSLVDFNLWMHEFAQQLDIELKELDGDFLKVKRRLQSFVAVSNHGHQETFVLHLKPKRNYKFKSGDLLAIYPANDHRERLYSIGKVAGKIRLSVKLHPQGLGSTVLHQLQEGEKLKGCIVTNPHFHFPKQASAVVMIANGTGIAPFLGMIDENKKRIPAYLYCGFREQQSFVPHQSFIMSAQEAGLLKRCEIAFSREGNKQYVFDLIKNDALFFAQTLKNGGTLMLCGSLAMQKDVFSALEEICQQFNGHGLAHYQAKNQILVDCY